MIESNFGRRKNAQCRWVSLCYSDVGRIFEIVFLFQWIVTCGKGERSKSGNGSCSQHGCGVVARVVWPSLRLLLEEVVVLV